MFKMLLHMKPSLRKHALLMMSYASDKFNTIIKLMDLCYQIRNKLRILTLKFLKSYVKPHRCAHQKSASHMMPSHKKTNITIDTKKVNMDIPVRKLPPKRKLIEIHDQQNIAFHSKFYGEEILRLPKLRKIRYRGQRVKSVETVANPMIKYYDPHIISICKISKHSCNAVREKNIHSLNSPDGNQGNDYCCENHNSFISVSVYPKKKFIN